MSERTRERRGRSLERKLGEGKEEERVERGEEDGGLSALWQSSQGLQANVCVCVCVDEHGKKRRVCHCRVVCPCTWEGGRALLIAGFPFLPERTGLFEWAGGRGSSAPEENAAVLHQFTWPFSHHTPHLLTTESWTTKQNKQKNDITVLQQRSHPKQTLQQLINTPNSSKGWK